MLRAVRPGRWNGRRGGLCDLVDMLISAILAGIYTNMFTFILHYKLLDFQILIYQIISGIYVHHVYGFFFPRIRDSMRIMGLFIIDY
jgi:hypothetical protein